MSKSSSNYNISWNLQQAYLGCEYELLSINFVSQLFSSRCTFPFPLYLMLPPPSHLFSYCAVLFICKYLSICKLSYYL